jgi:hypothetical protein
LIHHSIIPKTINEEPKMYTVVVVYAAEIEFVDYSN